VSEKPQEADRLIAAVHASCAAEMQTAWDSLSQLGTPDHATTRLLAEAASYALGFEIGRVHAAACEAESVAGILLLAKVIDGYRAGRAFVEALDDVRLQ
jgi:hypothetical protein